MQSGADKVRRAQLEVVLEFGDNLRLEIERAIRKSGDKPTELHLRAALHCIDTILDAKTPPRVQP